MTRTMRRVRRIEELVRRLERIPDRDSPRDRARSLMEAILELHGAGHGEMMEIVARIRRARRQRSVRRFANDALVASLLRAPRPASGRSGDARAAGARQASHGNAELLGVFEGVGASARDRRRLRLDATTCNRSRRPSAKRCPTRPKSSSTKDSLHGRLRAARPRSDPFSERSAAEMTMEQPSLAALRKFRSPARTRRRRCDTCGAPSRR